MCTTTECSVEYTRGKLNVQNDYDFIKKRVPSFDRTVNNDSKHSNQNFDFNFIQLSNSYEEISSTPFLDQVFHKIRNVSSQKTQNAKASRSCQ